MKNKEIRDALKKKGMYFWQLADLMGVSEPTVMRWMRHELPPDEKKRILGLIRKGEIE